MNLYTKYRSQKFNDVIGQKYIVQIISNALKSDRVGHAYLFSGPRGTGKTTLARLLAKSLNCIERKKGEYEPCDQCMSCREIINGTSMDIIEIDAASNRGIDDVRQLREKIKFAPTGKKYKIFIIDEVHMLTREAFNALLKTLEEPPKHAIFILATTELHKVPDTIISRTQQFDFKLHNLGDIIKRLERIAKEEKIQIDNNSLSLIAFHSKGGMRDAISLLDQVSNASSKIDEKITREILGLGSFQSLIDFIEKLHQKDTAKLLEILDNLNSEGIDFSEFINELLELLRKILIYKYDFKKILSGYTSEEKKELEKLASLLSKKEILIYIKKLLEAYGEMKSTYILDLPLELAIFELTKDSTDEINNKNISHVASIVLQPKKQNNNIKIVSGKYIKKTIKKEEKSIKAAEKNESNETIDFLKVKSSWDDFIKNLAKTNHSISILLKESMPTEFKNDKLVIGVQFKFYKERLENKKIFNSLCVNMAEYFKCNLSPKFIVDGKLVKKINENVNTNSEKITSDLMADVTEVFG